MQRSVLVALCAFLFWSSTSVMNSGAQVFAQDPLLTSSISTQTSGSGGTSSTSTTAALTTSTTSSSTTTQNVSPLITVVPLSANGAWAVGPLGSGIVLSSLDGEEAEFQVSLSTSSGTSTGFVLVSSAGSMLDLAGTSGLTLSAPLMLETDAAVVLAMATTSHSNSWALDDESLSRSWLDNYAGWFNTNFGIGWSETAGGYIHYGLTTVISDETLAQTSDGTLLTGTIIVSVPTAIGIVAGGEVLLGIGTFGGTATGTAVAAGSATVGGGTGAVGVSGGTAGIAAGSGGFASQTQVVLYLNRIAQLQAEIRTATALLAGGTLPATGVAQFQWFIDANLAEIQLLWSAIAKL